MAKAVVADLESGGAGVREVQTVKARGKGAASGRRFAP
jgi:hypothetical protein